MYTIDEYLKLNPNASLKDWGDYLTSCEEATKQYENEQYKKCEDFYKELEGRYFIINFNGASFCIIKVDKWPSNQYVNKYDCYNIYNDSYKSSIEFERRNINRYWFNNPYEKKYYGSGSTKCKEITKEEYDDIVDKAKKIKEIIGSINLK